MSKDTLRHQNGNKEDETNSKIWKDIKHSQKQCLNILKSITTFILDSHLKETDRNDFIATLENLNESKSEINAVINYFKSLPHENILKEQFDDAINSVRDEQKKQVKTLKNILDEIKEHERKLEIEKKLLEKSKLVVGNELKTVECANLEHSKREKDFLEQVIRLENFRKALEKQKEEFEKKMVQKVQNLHTYIKEVQKLITENNLDYNGEINHNLEEEFNSFKTIHAVPPIAHTEISKDRDKTIHIMHKTISSRNSSIINTEQIEDLWSYLNKEEKKYVKKEENKNEPQQALPKSKEEIKKLEHAEGESKSDNTKEESEGNLSRKGSKRKPTLVKTAHQAHLTLPKEYQERAELKIQARIERKKRESLEKILKDVSTKLEGALEKLSRYESLPLPLSSRNVTMSHDKSTTSHHADLSKEELIVLASKMSDKIEGLEIKSRRVKLKQYDNCFIAKEFVDWVVHSGCANSRNEAINIGRKMQELGLIENVVKGSSNFKDGPQFYRFITIAIMEREDSEKTDVYSPASNSGLSEETHSRRLGRHHHHPIQQLHIHQHGKSTPIGPDHHNEPTEVNSNRKRRYSKVDTTRLESIRGWLNELLNEDLPREREELVDNLKDGTILCRSMNKLKPGSIKFMHHKPATSTLRKENLQHFVNCCESEFHISKDLLFEPEDLLYSDNTKKVINLLYELMKKVKQESEESQDSSTSTHNS